MMDILEIGDCPAVVQYDPDIDMVCGELIGLNGGEPRKYIG